MVGLDFASNGTLYGVDQTTNGGFYSINTTTGAATLVFNTFFVYEGDVAYAGGNIFYATAEGSGGDHLIRLDSGAKTSVDEGVIASGKFFPGLDFDQSGRLVAFATDGSIYAIPGFSSSGAGTFLSNSGINVGGATFVSTVPEPTSLAPFGLGLTGLGAYATRRRPATSR